MLVTARSRLIKADPGGAHGVIAKPFSRKGLLAAMRYVEQCVSTPPPRRAATAKLRPFAGQARD